MRRVAVLMSAFAVVLWTVSAFAQAKPNFAGTWTREAPAGGAAAGGGGGGGGRGGGGGGGGWGAECTITQTATDLTVEYMGGGQTPAPIKLVYKLDGTESVARHSWLTRNSPSGDNLMTSQRSTSIICPSSATITFRKVSRLIEVGSFRASRLMIDSRASCSFSFRSREKLGPVSAAGCISDIRLKVRTIVCCAYP